MSDIDETIFKLREIFSEPNGLFYRSDIILMVGDVCEEVEKLQKLHAFEGDRSAKYIFQRDRLAEALQKISEADFFDDWDNVNVSFTAGRDQVIKLTSGIAETALKELENEPPEITGTLDRDTATA